MSVTEAVKNPVIITDRVRSTRGGYIFSLFVCSHLGGGYPGRPPPHLDLDGGVPGAPPEAT